MRSRYLLRDFLRARRRVLLGNVAEASGRGPSHVRASFRVVLALLLGCALSSTVSTSSADEPPRPYDALRAGADAAARHEARRLSAIRMQLDTIGLMKWNAGLPPRNYDRFYYYGVGPWLTRIPFASIARQSIGQRQVQTGPNRWESYPVYPETPFLQPSNALPATELAPPPDRNGNGPPPIAAPAAPPQEPENQRPARPGPREF